MSQKKVIIIGAGPAGLTAAYELLDKTDHVPHIFEMSNEIGGISKTVNYKGNRIDIGGHRFFSKSKRVNEWWQNILPLQGAPACDDRKLNREVKTVDSAYIRPIKTKEPKKITPPDPEIDDNVFLYRFRFSRILFLKKFFKYPISINWETICNLGPIRIITIFFSYVKTKLFPQKTEEDLESFLINRFGHRLYEIFFKSYTEKVWGVPCNKIKSAWGAQRIKGLSITQAVWHAVKKFFIRDDSIQQKKTEASLIERFLYPKFGPGQMWERTAEIVQKNGAHLTFHQKVIGLKLKGHTIQSITLENTQTKERKELNGDYFISTMPVKELIRALGTQAPKDVQTVAAGLKYRDFMTVGVLVDKLKVKNTTKEKTVNDLIPENWIYIQEPDVKLCRLQIFNNWSPYMLKDPNKVWLGLEYMCQEDDELWCMTDQAFARFAIQELEHINFIDAQDVLDSVVIRMPKAYPAYFGTYEEFPKVREFTDKIENLFLVGRNGMHRYNNQDHSMLTAMTAVENIRSGSPDKNNIWSVNLEKKYHEEKTDA